MDLWKDIPNFEGLYQASKNGEIRSLEHIRKNGTNEYIQKGRILKFNKNHSGYLQVRLSKNGIAKTYRVNRLIALTFIESILLIIGGLNPFESILISMSTAGTGGFSYLNSSLATFSLFNK